MCRAFGYVSMVGRAGASKDAPVSVRPVRLTPSGSTTHEISLSGGGYNLLLTGGALWLKPSPGFILDLPFLSAFANISLKALKRCLHESTGLASRRYYCGVEKAGDFAGGGFT
ncbi:ash family protein [Brenneria sp. 4F2]|nr:ash family protein [Brenneria bubanii]